jgi:hypothetical protein
VEPKAVGGPRRHRSAELPRAGGRRRLGPPVGEDARIGSEVGRCADQESVRLVDPLPVDVTEIADEEDSRLLGGVAALLQRANRGHGAQADVDDRDGKEDRDRKQRPA